VTNGTILREARSNMVGIGCAFVIRVMAGHAAGGQTCILPAGMALRTLLPGMRARKRKLRLAVIK
jgi:hypothetical protein